ncbi:hypothetical protein [Dankookia sp. P2]|uniref:hypothetical protein n=1 Tax=Dankookia sp. P2 TaxID=3423955 RepID=UPI003D67C11A
MRLPMLVLLGLMLVAGPALALAPAHHAARSAATAKPPVAKSRPGAVQAKAPSGHGKPRLQQAAFRPGAAPAGCSRKARQCRGIAATPVRFGWTQGSPPAAQVQADQCPDGTMATLARGHDDVIRCMPI